jgi:hypothetical protein
VITQRKRTLLAIVLTAGLTSACWYFAMQLRWGVSWLWLESTVKAPGRMALSSIHDDLAAGRNNAAQAKLEALQRQWEIFEREGRFRGEGIGSIMETFFQLENETGK